MTRETCHVVPFPPDEGGCNVYACHATVAYVIEVGGGADSPDRPSMFSGSVIQIRLCRPHALTMRQSFKSVSRRTKRLIAAKGGK